MATSPPSTSAIPPAIRNLLLDLLAKADLGTVTPRHLREGLESIQNAQKVAPPADESRHIPASFDFDANKKQVNKIIRAVFDQVSAGGPPAAGGLATDSTPSSQSTPAPTTSQQSPPPPKTTFPVGGGLALPGLGGVRGSHASPPPPHTNGNSTDGDAALAAKLQAQQDAKALPATRGSSTASSSRNTSSAKKRKVKSDPDEIESGEDSDVEAAAASAASKSRSRSVKKTKKDADKKPRAANPNNPFNRPVLLSPAMAEICGSDELPRHGVVKQLWAYVKARDLQNPNNKRQIMCDEKLQQLFGKPMVDSFEMSKLIGSHLKKKEDVVS